MLKRFVMVALSVSLLGFSFGCGGPGEVTTRPKAERPEQGYNNPKEVDEDTGLPEGVSGTRPGRDEGNR